MEDDSGFRLTGGCQCGAVRYALTAAPSDSSICHCRMCQKAVGGPFAALATVRRAHLTWTRGEPARFASSSLATRGFCAACGTPLTYEGVSADQIAVTTCSLDNPLAAPPARAYGIEGRVAWLDSIGALPAIETEEIYAGLVNHQQPDRDG
jgi:hypothetical protein